MTKTNFISNMTKMMRKIIETKYTVYNKLVAKKYWIHASILLGELISLHDYHEQKWTLSPSWDFYVSTNYIKDWVWLSRYNQQVAINILEKAWLISVYIENNNLRYFHLNEEKICEITWYDGGAKNWHPLLEISTPCQKLAGGWEWVAGGWEKLAPINKEYKINNKNNNIGEKNFSNADASPSSDVVVDSKLSDGNTKKLRKTKKQQRYDEVVSSVEFNTAVLEWITNEVEKEEIKTLWSEYVELRCSKDYRAFTDGAVKRNLKVLEGTTFPERKAILDKSVTKGWTWLFPLNEYDMKRIQWDLAKVEWSDEWLYDKIFTTKCKEKEDELPEWSTHDLLMELVEKYWEERVKKIYYEKVRPKIEEIYWIKRDWVK